MKFRSHAARLAMALFTILAFVVMPATSFANHSWNGYHWARTANPFTLNVGDNVTSAWDSYLNTSISDWSQSTVLDLNKVAGGAGNVRRCRATSGRVEVCNAAYGNTGWLGIASISVSGSHITSGTVKLNDTYYSSATYNTPAWRNLVMCQEIGHTFGLDHQDETFDNPNLGTCMDYTNDPSSNQHPNKHDYDELLAIYSHLDTTTTVGAVVPFPMAAFEDNDPGHWGRVVRVSNDGRAMLFERDLGLGNRIFRFVYWIEPRGRSFDH